ncbi:hypothetical protein QKW35_20585 [Pontibacterium granulatum]|uniref:hypothetical protein n=1 Tax=Pontibacterium granulatum TaxID=2036029 RepID=UPI00249B08B1|nr:hypothetical protein [Pontibacterium granulatum]MDI3326781.1 hypothetical protein [Pontibacterium granulatum]
MPILKDDIKLMAAERLTDNEDGGGRITGTQVQDGASNNLFPDVSDLDRVYGRVNLRKAFLSVETDATDVYYGSHIILSERPTDPKIGVTLFSTDSPTDERSGAQTRLESYLVRGPESHYILLGDQIEGQRMVLCYALESAPVPEVGDAYVLSTESGGNVVAEQFVRLTAVEHEIRSFTDINGTFDRRVFTLEISDALRQTFQGVETAVRYSSHESATLLRTTQVADASRYYGIAALDAPVGVGDLAFKTDTIYSQLVPSATTETSVVDVQAGHDSAFLVPTRDTAYTGTIYMTSGKNILELGRAIVPGSLDIYGTYTDTADGLLLKDGQVRGTVDHETGTIVVNSSVISGSPSIEYMPAAKVSHATHNLAEKITLGNRGYNYVNNLQPVPEKGSVTIDYMAQGRWYRLIDDGNGGLSDGAGGSGTVDYTTGSTMVTLGALPDTDSSLIYNWGSPVHFQNHAGTADVELSEYRYTATEGELQPGTVTLSWPAGGSTVTVTDDGNGNFSGSAIGGVDYMTGEIRFKPTVVPDSGAIITVDYDYAEPGNQSHTESVQGNGNNVSFTLPNAPLKPGMVSLTVSDDFTEYWGDVFTASASGTDNGSGAISGRNTHIEFTGGINYETGEVNLLVTRGRSYQWNGSEWVMSPSIPFGGIVLARYVDASTAITPIASSYTFSAGDIKLQLTPSTTNAIVPGSVDFTWGGINFVDDAGGLIQRTSDSLTVGSIDYASGTVTLQTYSENSNTLTVNGLLTTFGDWYTQQIYFRTPGAPLRPASLYLRVTDINGNLITATSDASGNISGDGISGTVIYETGIVDLQFTNDVFPHTALFNCVVYSTLPLDADVLGLDPVRLPVDGRVPVFRDGNVVVIHHTDTTTMPDLVTAGQTVSLGAIRISEANVADANGTAVPASAYTFDLVAGTITFADPLDLSAYTQPLTVTHRIEDMALITDVQINGQMQAVSQISHDYPAGALVSSALIVGDVQARVANLYDQQTWSGEWSDNLIGSETTAEFNDTTYPLEVTNRGAITERWALIFTGTTAFKIVGESVGEIAVGDTSSTLAPINPNTGAPYFTLNPLGWGSGWSTNNVLRFNTVGANHPMWLARTTLQGAAEGDSDSFRIQIRGNANA